MIRLLIADDHAIVRAGINQLVALTNKIKVIAEASTGGEVLNFLNEVDVDLILLDLNMPSGGIELIRQIKSAFPKLPILIYSMHDDAHIAIEAFKAGVSGYFTKNSDPTQLMSAIFKVFNGERYIDQAIAEKMAFESAFPGKKLPHTLLSARELEIFRLMIVGMSGNEIAQKLFISTKTVSTHKSNLFQKMELHTVADLVLYAVHHNLLD
ncbi:MAG: response regulator transcription factor [Sideroxydans sp.]|nr:response regulator transcription factor [Sideroxydans sp.]